MESAIRLKIFNWLQEQTIRNGEVFERSLLEKGLTINRERITLIGPRGIWKPKSFKYPISITTTAGSPYNDTLKDDFLSYSYRGLNLVAPLPWPQHLYMGLKFGNFKQR